MLVLLCGWEKEWKTTYGAFPVIFILREMRWVLFYIAKQEIQEINKSYIMQLLSDDEIRIIQAYFYDEQSERQIAEKLSISKTAQHYKKTKILTKLKKFIGQ